MDRPDQTDPSRPKLWGPKRRWLLLLAWVLMLAGVVIAQRLTAHSFPTGNWTPDGNTPATLAELTWYRLPLMSLAVICIVFLILARRLVPEKGMRSVIRAWGLFATVVAILLSLTMSLFFNALVFYMD